MLFEERPLGSISQCYKCPWCFDFDTVYLLPCPAMDRCRCWTGVRASFWSLHILCSKTWTCPTAMLLFFVTKSWDRSMSGRPDLAPATSCLEPESVCKNHAGFLDCLVIMLLLTGNLVEVAFLAQLSSTASTLVVFAAKTPVRPPRPCTSDAGQTVPNLIGQRPVGIGMKYDKILWWNMMKYDKTCWTMMNMMKYDETLWWNMMK